MRFGLQGQRLRKGLTLEQLATVSGISPANLSRLENAKQAPRPATVQRLAEALGIAPAELWVEDAPKQYPSARDFARPRELTNRQLRLREWRSYWHDRSLSELAHRSGISVATLKAIEDGTAQPRWLHVRALASAFMVPLWALYEAPSPELAAQIGFEAIDDAGYWLNEARGTLGLAQIVRAGAALHNDPHPDASATADLSSLAGSMEEPLDLINALHEVAEALADGASDDDFDDEQEELSAEREAMTRPPVRTDRSRLQIVS